MHIRSKCALFIVAGLMEIGGRYLIWLWLRDGREVLLGALGGLLLFVYGVLPTFQPSHFGRVYAVYGGVFVVMSLQWGWWVDGRRPGTADFLGGSVCLIGVAVIMYRPGQPDPMRKAFKPHPAIESGLTTLEKRG